MNRIANCKLQIENCKLASFPRSAWERTACDALRRPVRRGASGNAGSHAERGNQRLLQFAISLAILLFASPAFAQQLQPPKIVGLRVGIADRYKAGLWTQVEVIVRGGSERLAGELSVIVPDGDGVPGRVSKPCQILPGQETTVRLITRFGHVDGDLEAVFHIGKEVIARRTFETTAMQADADHFLPALESQSLIVVVGDSTLGMDEVGKLGGGEPRGPAGGRAVGRHRASADALVRLRRRRRRHPLYQPAGNLPPAGGEQRPGPRRSTSGCAWEGGWCCAWARRPTRSSPRTRR